MNTLIIYISILGGINVVLVVSLLILTKLFSNTLHSMVKALLAKDLTDYTVNTPNIIKNKTEEKKDIYTPVEMLTDDEFNKQIEKELNG